MVNSIRITNFSGIAPKISPELLPDTAGQIAKNCKLHSGDLIPYPRPIVIDNTKRTDIIKTLFALRDPNTNEKKWLSWTTDVDIVVAYNTDTGEQRFYYTGDGAPKISNYKLATSGSPPYPTQYYDLGLPIPEERHVLQPTAIVFTPKSISSYARDASNVVTITTSTPHGLRTGNFITVSGFNYIQGTYSQSGTIITVTINNHGLSNGAQVVLDFVTGSAVDGTYVVSNATTNTFEVTSSVNQTTSGIVRWDIRNFNATNVECTVVNSTTFTYFSPGPAVATTFSLVGKVELGGLPQARSYVFTWYTPWKEESIASKPSSELFIKEGTTVTISNIPTSKPSGNNFIRGVRLYRTLASAAKSDYFLLSTLWFPIKITKVKRLSSVSTITTLYPHNLDVDDRFLIRGLDSFAVFSFNVAGTVKDIVDDYTFTFIQSNLEDVSETIVNNGFVYHDIAEDPLTMPPRYWGYVVSGTYIQTGTTITVTIPNHGFVVGTKVYLKFTSGAGVNGVYSISSVTSDSFTVIANSLVNTSGNVIVDGYIFIDDFDSRNLIDVLDTNDYDPPPKNLQGLTVIQNNIMCGFVGNTLYFSEPGAPHAWPASYAISFEHNIVGIAAVSGSALVLTESYPYLVSGSDPANGMSVARIDANLPCVSKKSIVTMGYGVVYSTHDGLAIYSPSSGSAIITKLLYDKDTWQIDINPKTIVAVYYDGKYFASHSNGSFIFEYEPKTGGFFVTTDYKFTTAWYDSIDGVVYFSDVNGDIYKWDDFNQPSIRQKWKSKVITTDNMINFGAARVIADYKSTSDTVSKIWNENTNLWKSDFSIWNAGFNSGSVIFRLWVNKQLEFETELFDSKMFRLPMGYLSDTFEVEVESDTRIRAIHLATTPAGLKEV